MKRIDYGGNIIIIGATVSTLYALTYGGYVQNESQMLILTVSRELTPILSSEPATPGLTATSVRISLPSLGWQDISLASYAQRFPESKTDSETISSRTSRNRSSRSWSFRGLRKCPFRRRASDSSAPFQ